MKAIKDPLAFSDLVEHELDGSVRTPSRGIRIHRFDKHRCVQIIPLADPEKFGVSLEGSRGCVLILFQYGPTMAMVEERASDILSLSRLNNFFCEGGK